MSRRGTVGAEAATVELLNGTAGDCDVGLGLLSGLARWNEWWQACTSEEHASL